jgi:MFS family permease
MNKSKLSASRPQKENPGSVATSHKRNVSRFMASEMFWGMGFHTASHITILPVFLVELGASNFLIGIVPALFAFGINASQLWGGYLTSHLKRKKAVVIAGHYLAAVPYGLLALYLVSNQNPVIENRTPMLLIFFILIAVFANIMGFLVPVWLNLVGKTVDPERRGTAFGKIFFTNTLGGAIGGAVASRILNLGLDFPLDFSICFAITFGAITICNFPLFLVQENDTEITGHRLSLKSYLGLIGVILRDDREYRSYLVARAWANVGQIVVLFFAAYSRRSLGFAQGDIAMLGAVALAVQAFSNLGLGHLADRVGYRRVIGYGYLALLVCGIAALSATTLWQYHILAALVGFHMASDNVGHGNLLMKLCPHEDKTDYIGAAGLLLSPLVISIPLAGGLLIDLYGFKPVVAGSMLFLVIGIVWLAAKSPKQKK